MLLWCSLTAYLWAWAIAGRFISNYNFSKFKYISNATVIHSARPFWRPVIRIRTVSTTISSPRWEIHIKNVSSCPSNRESLYKNNASKTILQYFSGRYTHHLVLPVISWVYRLNRCSSWRNHYTFIIINTPNWDYKNNKLKLYYVFTGQRHLHHLVLRKIFFHKLISLIS